MKKIVFFIIGILFVVYANGQKIKIQGGASISKLDWNLIGTNSNSFYEESLIAYSFFVGLDYLENQYFNLSSNIGTIQKGGKGEIPLSDQNGDLTGQTIIEKPSLDYFSINTMIELKYRIKETVTPFISFGPRFDYLYSSSKHFDVLEEKKELKNTSYGLILGGGMKYDISNFQFGLRADYYYDFTKVAEWTIENTGISGEATVNAFTINLTMGYKLK